MSEGGRGNTESKMLKREAQLRTGFAACDRKMERRRRGRWEGTQHQRKAGFECMAWKKIGWDWPGEMIPAKWQIYTVRSSQTDCALS